MTEECEVDDLEILEVSAEESAQFEQYKKGLSPDENGQVSIDIPFGFTVGAATVAGIFHLRDPIEDSSAEGAVAGVINGTFRLNRKKTRAKLFHRQSAAHGHRAQPAEELSAGTGRHAQIPRRLEQGQLGLHTVLRPG